MMTIKEMSKLTGVSTRTLRYYDEIGLFSPTEKSKSGYRLYDQNALEKLRQILYFREMDIPLNSIKQIISDPALDKNNILKMQKTMLESEKNRIERLIDSIDAALKGADMDFTVFDRAESIKLFEALAERMPEVMKDAALKEFGSVEKWRDHYLNAARSKKVQNQFAKMIEWYGDANASDDMTQIDLANEIEKSYQRRIDHILEKLNLKRSLDINSFDIRAIIGEYGFVIRQELGLRDEKEMMLSIAKHYTDKDIKADADKNYGDGFSDYLSKAITAFYER
ncbi:MAG: MerR family transcriptional regulator [Clostridia bacterium]|nr:MerR family transcriptional regulator [Clostridia bacterium]